MIGPADESPLLPLELPTPPSVPPDRGGVIRILQNREIDRSPPVPPFSRKSPPLTGGESRGGVCPPLPFWEEGEFCPKSPLSPPNRGGLDIPNLV